MVCCAVQFSLLCYSLSRHDMRCYATLSVLCDSLLSEQEDTTKHWCACKRILGDKEGPMKQGIRHHLPRKHIWTAGGHQ